MTVRKGKRRTAILLALEAGPRSTNSLVKDLGLKWAAVTGVLESPSMQHLVEQDAERRWCLRQGAAVQEALAEARELVGECAKVQPSEQPYKLPTGTCPHGGPSLTANLPLSSHGAGEQ